MEPVFTELSEQQWQQIVDLLPGKASHPGRTAQDNRKFVQAVLWVKKTNSKWVDLPAEFGNHKSTHKRYMSWQKKGLWKQIFQRLGQDIETGLPVHQPEHLSAGSKPCQFDLK